MTGKTIKETMITGHTYRVFPNDLNSKGTVFGGLIMSTIDRLCLVVAERHAGTTCVTVSVDALHFLAPAGRGDNLIFHVAMNRAWRTSMEIGAKVMAEGPDGSVRHIVSAYFTFVALDEFNHPTEIPQLIIHGEVEKRRYHEADMRRKHRVEQKALIEASRKEGTHEKK